MLQCGGLRLMRSCCGQPKDILQSRSARSNGLQAHGPREGTWRRKGTCDRNHCFKVVQCKPGMRHAARLDVPGTGAASVGGAKQVAGAPGLELCLQPTRLERFRLRSGAPEKQSRAEGPQEGSATAMNADEDRKERGAAAGHPGVQRLPQQEEQAGR